MCRFAQEIFKGRNSTEGKYAIIFDLDHWLPGNDLVTRAKKVQFSTEFELFEPVVKCICCSDPEVSKNFGNSSPRKEKESKILADIKENFEFISSVATWAQVRGFFGGVIGPDRFPCCCATGSIIMVILTKKVDVALDEMTDNDWTTGTYQNILANYNASEVKDFPTVHAVDILSIATQCDPVPMKDVPIN